MSVKKDGANLAVKYRNVGDIKGYDRNARTHSDEHVAQIAASIEEFGFNNPILIDETSTIIAGHGRLAAAQRLGLDSVPCIVLAHLTDAQRRAYILADNKLALNAGWDEELLRSELLDLQGEGVDLELIGFSSAEIGELLEVGSGEGLTDPDDVPEAKPEVFSVSGDLWLLGEHRVICGDSIDKNTVDRLLAGSCPHLMVTDPPYGVEYDASWRDRALSGGGKKDTATGKVLNDDNADWSSAWALFPGDVAYVWHAGAMGHVVAESLLGCGFAIRAQIVWAKSQLVISRGNYHSQHEPCWYAVRKGKTGHFVGNRKQTTLWRFVADLVRPDERIFVCRVDDGLLAISGDESTVWEIPKPLKSETGHSTQKPVECMARPMRNNSKKGDFVYEPFCGSGTTIIAAEQLGRRCLAVELSPEYVDIIVRRWQNFTGKRAVHAVTGKEFPVGPEV